jgi:hypothetical protein
LTGFKGVFSYICIFSKNNKNMVGKTTFETVKKPPLKLVEGQSCPD